MVSRLSPRDAMFYFLDEGGSSTQLGALLIIPATDDRRRLDYPRLVSLVENRLQTMPRYRQIVRQVTLGLARPVWADDPDFDINFHIRRSGLPRPGGIEQLQDLIARVMARPLDRTRPLWEMYLIEGLADGTMAILTKSHRCLVGGSGSPEISEVICDESPDTAALPEDLWMPGAVPGGAQLALGALAEALSRPGDLVDSLVSGNGPVADLRATAGATARRVGSVVQQLTDSAPSSPLNNATTSSRMFTVATVPTDVCDRIASAHGFSRTDVVLALLTGAMRRWLMSFGDAVSGVETVRVVLPLSAQDPMVDPDPDSPRRWVIVGTPGFVTDLPVGEDNPTVRLAQVAELAQRHSQSSRRVSLGLRPLLPELGVVPFAEISSRAFSTLDRRSYNVPVTMGTGPVGPRFVCGLPVAEIYAVPALLAQRALAVTIVDHGGRLQFAFLADRGVLSDLPAMAEYVTESLDELVTED
ncbi:wax ester/triacylglycerol synthase family O-acyltransferase [Gordonia soli]|uniref:Diacylglycerol O-acyltransferase n=1 Tax=Gordonia soli NBRC 108243 TaxID=1223545 RepID=M0QEH2_9ACTN|nr:wax ester/triacylglycerol synthase family O-acyltransferase [Gordonia soli]GAC66726.1 putative acyltransferase [Gordonia soli NBRC 108243]